MLPFFLLTHNIPPPLTSLTSQNSQTLLVYSVDWDGSEMDLDSGPDYSPLLITTLVLPILHVWS